MKKTIFAVHIGFCMEHCLVEKLDSNYPDYKDTPLLTSHKGKMFVDFVVECILSSLASVLKFTGSQWIRRGRGWSKVDILNKRKNSELLVRCKNKYYTKMTLIN